jgi:hypothetical protein
MDISSGWVDAGAAVSAVVVTIAGAWIHSAFASRDERLVALKGTQTILFDKLDIVTKALQDYKLHVAETYVNQAALQKMIDPIDRRLENIEKE